jgi:hypothetical protein
LLGEPPSVTHTPPIEHFLFGAEAPVKGYFANWRAHTRTLDQPICFIRFSFSVQN